MSNLVIEFFFCCCCFPLHGCIRILLCQFNKIGHLFLYLILFFKKMYAVTPCLIVVVCFSDYGLMEHAPATIMEC